MMVALIKSIAGITGTFISAIRTGLSTGPIIVLVAAGIFFISYFISPTGQISKYRRKMQFRKQGDVR